MQAELRKAAQSLLAQQRPGHTLQATALVNEAFVKLYGGSEQAWTDHSHMLAVASLAMRQILVDHARRRNAATRPPSDRKLPLEQVVLAFEADGVDVISLHEALEELESFDPLMAEILNCRFFLGQTNEQLARAFDIPLRSLERRWAPTFAWLLKRLR